MRGRVSFFRRAVGLAILGLALAGASTMAREAPTLGNLEIKVDFPGDDGQPRTIGPVAFNLTCTEPVAFAQTVTTGPTGHLSIAAPIGKCTLASVHPVTIDDKAYAWTADVEFSSQRSVLRLSGDNARVGGTSEAASASVPARSPAPPGLHHVEVGHDDSGAATTDMLVMVDPDYPDAARRARLEGRVDVTCLVDAGGHVSNVKIVRSSNTIFNDAAVRAVSERRYLPATRGGHAVPVEFTIRVDFRLR